MQIEPNKRRSLDFSVKAAWLAISKMYNLIGQDFDVSHSTGFVLLNIDREKGTPATKIAPLMGMEARSLSRMLKTMEEKGWITRSGDDEDGRRVIVELTETGREKRELARQTVKAFHQRIKEEVSPEQLDTFFDVIDRVLNVVETLSAKYGEMSVEEKYDDYTHRLEEEKEQTIVPINRPAKPTKTGKTLQIKVLK